MQEATISANELNKFLILLRMSEERYTFFSDREVMFFIGSIFIEKVVAVCGSSSHEKTGWIAISEDLSKLLEVKLVIFSDIDESEEVFELLIFREGL